MRQLHVCSCKLLHTCLACPSVLILQVGAATVEMSISYSGAVLHSVRLS